MNNRKQVLRFLLGVIVILLSTLLLYNAAKRQSILSAKLSSYEYRIVELSEELTEKKQIEAEKIFEWPMHSDDYQYSTSWFGLRNIPSELYKGGSPTRDHTGIDIRGFEEARITPIAFGEIVDHWYPPGWHNGTYYSGDPILGGKIIIDHHNGWYSVYGHMDVTYFNEGDWVTPEDVIGRQGSTGMSTGPHLHFELWDGWENPVQPLRHMKEPNVHIIW